MARERDSGELTAIQCKFYEPTRTLAKGDIDSFFTASGKTPFPAIVATDTRRPAKVGCPLYRVGLITMSG